MAVAFSGAASAFGQSQGVLPTAGVDMRAGDLRAAFDGTANATAPVVSPPGWTWTPSIDIAELFDDGVALRNGRTGTDVSTQFTPGVAVTIVTERLVGSLAYAPTIAVSATGGGTTLAQNLNAYATVELVPGMVYVDLRGYAARQALVGGQTLGSTGYLSGQDQVQAESFSLSPYIRQRLGGTGTLLAGIGVGRTLETTDRASLVASPYYQPVDTRVTTTQAHASFTTGEDFGRLFATASAVTTHYDGTGALHAAYRTIVDLAPRYAITRAIAVTAAIGHEDLRYSTPTPYVLHDITWSGGVRLTPDAETVVELGYGHHDGGNSVALDSSFAPTARTRVFARYSEGIGTSVEDLQNALSASIVGPGGVSVDRQTGAPLLIGNPFFGTQAGLYHTARASVTGTILYDRDTWALTAERDQQNAVGVGAGGFAPNNRGVFASLGWAHGLSEQLSTSAFAQIGSLIASGLPGVPATTQNSLTMSVGADYAFTPTLHGRAQYSRATPFGGGAEQADPRDVGIIGLHKDF